MRNGSNTKKAKHHSTVNFHAGNTLLTIADTYPTLMEVIEEAIQNALDADARLITVKINKKRRDITINDDGAGVSKFKFEKALQSVNMSIKSDEKLGQFGRGLIAPMGKCKCFTLTSKTNQSKHYLKWEFNTETLKKQAKELNVPMTEEKDIMFTRSGGSKSMKNSVNWKTQVKIVKYTGDRMISMISLKRLEANILDRYGKVMLKRGVIVEIIIDSKEGKEHKTIRASKFKGKRLPTVTKDSKDAGQTDFEMFISPKTETGRKGKILVGIRYDDFRINIRTFIKKSGLFNAEIAEVLNSGVFEGEIISEKCKLDPDRKGFKSNDALVDFIAHIEQWVKEVAEDEMERLDDLQKTEKWQKLGRKSILVIEEIIKNNPHLQAVLDSATRGTIGTHHYEDDKTVVGRQKEKSLTSHKVQNKKNSNKSTATPTSPVDDHPKHVPFTVTGPKGMQRAIVKGHSTGLQLAYSDMPGSERLWVFDPKICRLTLNVRHPIFVEAEKYNWLLCRMQELVALNVLTMEGMEDKKAAAHMVDHLEQLLKPQIGWLGKLVPGRCKR